MVIYYFHVCNGIFKICNVYNHAKSLFTTRVVAYLIVNVYVLNYQSYLLLGVVTYSLLSRHWEVFFFPIICRSNLRIYQLWRNFARSPRLTPLKKNQEGGWSNLTSSCIVRISLIYFTLKHQQTWFLGPIWLYTNFEEIWNFVPKP